MIGQFGESKQYLGEKSKIQDSLNKGEFRVNFSVVSLEELLFETGPFD